MSSKKKAPPIRAVLGLRNKTDGQVTPLLDGSLKGLLANTAIYTKLPIDLTSYGNAISAYEGSIPAALDGSRTAAAQKNKFKESAIKMYGQLAKYVEANCSDDLATFLLSGFKARSNARTLTPPTSDSIRKVEHGANSGQLVATLMAFPGATSYVLRWAPVPAAGGTPPTWTELALAKIRPAPILSNLTPGTTYAFQVKALTKSGYTDWSDSVTMMCT